jgi:hypothetical protein
MLNHYHNYKDVLVKKTLLAAAVLLTCQNLAYASNHNSNPASVGYVTDVIEA